MSVNNHNNIGNSNFQQKDPTSNRPTGWKKRVGEGAATIDELIGNLLEFVKEKNFIEIIVPKLEKKIKSLVPKVQRESQKQEDFEQSNFCKQNPFSRDQAATIIQSYWRRHSVEKKILLPGSLSKYLRKNLQKMSEEEICDLSKVIARQTTEMLSNPKKFQKEGVRINCSTEEVFLDPVTKEQSLVKVPRTVWLYLSDDESSLRVQLYSKELVGQGTYKIVKSSKTVVVDLVPGHRKEMKILNSVYIKSKDQIDPEFRKNQTLSVIEKRENEDIQILVNSMIEASKIFTKNELENDPNIRIKALPDVTREYTGKKGIKRLEWEEPMYFGSDFGEICKKGNVKIGDGTVANMNNFDKLRIIRSVIYTCQKMHEKGVVHRDVKSPNIFITYDGQLQGDLGDFDLLTGFGNNELKSNYGYWDLCSADGLVLPTTDIFGSAVTFAESIFDMDLMVLSDVRNGSDSLSMISTLLDFYAENRSKERVNSFVTELNDKLGADEFKFLQKVAQRAKKLNTCEYVKEVIKNQLFSIADDEIRVEFGVLFADLELYEETAKLMKEIFRADKDLYDFINQPDNKAAKAILSFSALADKKAELDEIYSRFPIFKNLGWRIAKLETQWKETSTQIASLLQPLVHSN